MEEKIIKISSSSLNLFLECSRCFWFQLNEGIKRPETPSSTLPNGIDLTLKIYFDYWRRVNGCPPLLKGKLPGRLFRDESLIAKFRSRSFQWFDKESGGYLIGVLDDALELENEIIVPLDNKTRGFPPLETHNAHLIQMSVYTLLLKENGFRTKNLAYLIYWFFDHRKVDLEKPLAFNISVEEVATEPERVRVIFREAVEILKKPSPPPMAHNCQFCHYVNRTKNY